MTLVLTMIGGAVTGAFVGRVWPGYDVSGIGNEDAGLRPWNSPAAGVNMKKVLIQSLLFVLICIPWPQSFPEATVSNETETVRLLNLVDRFTGPDFGIAEAERHFRMNVREIRDHGNGFKNIWLVTPPGMQRLVLETHEGSLIGMQIDFTYPGSIIDISVLTQRWGEPSRGMAPFDSFFPASYIFKLPRKHYLVSVILQPRKKDPPEAMTIIDIIIRRIDFLL